MANLATQVLSILDEDSRNPSSGFKGDKDIAAATGCEVPEVQRQLEILASKGLVELSKRMGLTYSARITTKGMVAIEELRTAGNA